MKMCFATVTNSAYQQYIPWFAYFIGRAYPEARCMFFVDGVLKSHVRKMLAEVFYDNFLVRENAFQPYENLDPLSIKYLRWLLVAPEFHDFDCLYMGDVDMAIFKEKPSYAEQHLAHCEMIGLPYSNFVRPNNNRALCGIHVVKPKEWFETMMPTIEKYRDKFARGEIWYNAPSQNEKMLYQMIAESPLGSPPNDLLNSYHECLVSSNHHGIHIRNAELNGFEGLKGARNHEIHAKEIIESTQSPLFDRLASMSPGVGRMMKQVAGWYANGCR